MVHKRPKIALNHVVSVTGYSLSFILLCLAASIQMRWAPSSFGKTSKADRCVLPINSEHSKFSENGVSPAETSSSFVHSALRKGNLLPVFATTRVVKQFRPARSLSARSVTNQTPAASQKQNQKRANSGSSRSALFSIRPHHTPPELKISHHAHDDSLQNANSPRSRSQNVSAAVRQPHHTPPVAKVSEAASPLIRPHHTPPKLEPSLALKLVDDLNAARPEGSLTTAKIPLPLGKPALQTRGTRKIGTIISPARAVGPPNRRGLKKRAPSSATAGFAVTHAVKLGHLAAVLHEKAPLFRPKPSKQSRPVHQSRCLALAIYYEARTEGTTAQFGLAKVIMSRVKSQRYPNTICGVVYQNAHLIGNCAFSFACDGRLERPQNKVAWARSRIVALSALCGKDCLQPRGEPIVVHKTKQGAQSAARNSNNNHRQITDRQMKNMGRDGVNAFLSSTNPAF